MEVREGDITGYTPIVPSTYFLNALEEYPVEDMDRLIENVFGAELSFLKKIDKNDISCLLPFSKGARLRKHHLFERDDARSIVVQSDRDGKRAVRGSG